MLRSTALALIVASAAGPALAQQVVHAFAITDSEGHQSLLIPSLHVPAPGIAQPASDVLKAKDSFLVVEHHASGGLGEGAGDAQAPWARALSFAQRTAYAKRANCAGATTDQAEAALRRPSVQVANQYAYTSCTVAFRPSRDALLMAAARTLRKRIDTLEDDRWVEGQRRRVPGAAQEEALRWILDRNVDDVLRPVVQAFNEGNFDAVARLTAESWGSESNAHAMYEPMVAERSARWMETLPALLREGGAVIEVGALHVTGPSGLVEQLRAREYRVESTTVPAMP